MSDEEEYEDEFEDDPIVIPLGEHLVAWISEADAEIANWGWTLKKAGTKESPHYYALRRSGYGKTLTEEYLHNVIWERMLGKPLPKGFLVDHINRDKLDNRRSNLRLATRTHNEANKAKRRGNTSSKYKGVAKMTDKRKKCWRATISENHKQIPLGTFYTEIEAAEAYNKEALERWGDFAHLNELDPDELKAAKEAPKPTPRGRKPRAAKDES